MEATPESVSQQQPQQQDEDSSNRQQSNIRNILEQVKSGQKNKSEAFHELRNILQSTVRKTGTDFSSSSIQQGSDGGETSSLPINTGLNTSIDGPRFTNEDRRILINHIIERKKRTEDDTVLAHGGLDPENDTLPSSTIGVGMQQHHRYRQEDEERPLSPSSSISGATRSLTGTHGRSRNRGTGGSTTRRDQSHSHPSYHQDRIPSGTMYNVNGTVNPHYRSMEPESDSFPHPMDSSYGTRGGGGGNSSGGYSGYDVRQRYDMDDMDATGNAAINSRYSYPGNDFFSDARSNRMVRHEASIREEMFKECTFRPTIKGLPPSYGVGKAETIRDGPFYDRVMRWREDKEKTASVKKQQIDRSSMQDCTFHPRMNRNSEKAVKEIRGQNFENSMPAGERLYRNSEAVYMMRARTIEEELRRERNEEDKECTFQPDISTEKYPHVKSKFLHRKRQPDPQEVEQSRMKNCTFTPKVKGINKNMASAKLYVSANVVERLTRGVGSPAREGSMAEGFMDGQGGEEAGDQSNVMDVASFMTSRTSHSRSGNNNQHNPSSSNHYETPYSGDGGAGQRGRRSTFAGLGSSDRRRASSAPSTRGSDHSFVTATNRSQSRDDQLTAVELRERDKRLQQFLGRQQQSSLRQQQHLEKLRSASTPKFRPELCRKSLQMSEQHFKGEFLDRVERDVLRRTDAEQKAISVKDYLCSFQPKLVSKKGDNIKSRSVYEMSRGDLLRRETSHRMMKLRIEREEHEQLTFQPVISKIGTRMQSSLKLREDPAFFLQHYKGLESGKAQRREMEKQHQMEREMEQCTFSPQTRDCPAYVKRIARSMHALKASKSIDQSMSNGNHNLSMSLQNKPSFRFGL